MFSKSLKTTIIALTLAATAATSVSAGEYRHHPRGGVGFNDAAAIGAAGFLLGTFIGATLHRPDGSTVTSRYPRVGPRNVRIYEERDPHGRVLKRKVLRKKKIKRKRKKQVTFASSYDPRTNLRTTSYRDARGVRRVIHTTGPALPPQVR